MKSALPYLVLVFLSGITGYQRFNDGATPQLWLDLAFLVSSAALLALVLIGFIRRLDGDSGGRRRRTRVRHQRGRRPLAPHSEVMRSAELGAGRRGRSSSMDQE